MNIPYSENYLKKKNTVFSFSAVTLRTQTISIIPPHTYKEKNKIHFAIVNGICDGLRQVFANFTLNAMQRFNLFMCQWTWHVQLLLSNYYLSINNYNFNNHHFLANTPLKYITSFSAYMLFNYAFNILTTFKNTINCLKEGSIDPDRIKNSVLDKFYSMPMMDSQELEKFSRVRQSFVLRRIYHIQSLLY